MRGDNLKANVLPDGLMVLQRSGRRHKGRTRPKSPAPTRKSVDFSKMKSQKERAAHVAGGAREKRSKRSSEILVRVFDEFLSQNRRNKFIATLRFIH